MNYISTRGQAPTLSFKDVVLAGLASDGGLYVPETIPQMSAQDIAQMAGLPYQEIAYRVMQPFVGDEIPEADLRRLIDDSYATFRHTNSAR